MRVKDGEKTGKELHECVNSVDLCMGGRFMVIFKNVVSKYILVFKRKNYLVGGLLGWLKSFRAGKCLGTDEGASQGSCPIC